MKALAACRAGRAPLRPVPRRAFRRHRDRRRRHDPRLDRSAACASTCTGACCSAPRAARATRRAHRRPTSSTGAAARSIELAHVPGRLLSLPGRRDQGLVRGSARRASSPTSILTHRGDDAHQDHREVCQLTWNTFRDHLILEYEIPKWDGDLGQPNVYVPVSRRGDGAQDRAAARAISARSARRTGSTTRPSAAWRGCAAWNAGRRSATPRPSTPAR